MLLKRFGESRMKQTNYITELGAARLKKELDFLWLDERPKVTQGVADAAAEGDRSENAEYIYGKKRLREIDRRIRFLRKRLEALTIVPAQEPKDPEKVFFSAFVDVEYEDGAEASYRLVGPDETAFHEGGISVDSPVGRALMGKRLDDEVPVRRPRGEAMVTIMNIRYETK